MDLDTFKEGETGSFEMLAVLYYHCVFKHV